MIVDLQANPKQWQFYCKALEAIHGLNDYRYFFYGGAIRGGKTFVCATLQLTLAKNFPNTRWHVIRSDFPALQKTTIPTFAKIVDGMPNWKWSRDKSNYFLYHRKTDSKIFFMGENISHDPELNSFLGLETNGIFYEQIEELSEKLWNIGNSRLGSWYVDKMPKPISLATFNPTQKWIKNKVHVPFLENRLPERYYYQLAYPDDNAFVTEEQKQGWQQLDERYKRQFILGDWTNFDHDGSRWAYAFDEHKHCVNELEFNPNIEIMLSFDFNKNPMSCIVFQSNRVNSLHIFDAIKLPNSDIYQMCQYINAHYPNKVFLVTGDASGNSGSAMVKDNLSYYKIIQSELRLSKSQLLIPSINPPLEKNRVLFNSVLSRGDFKMLAKKTGGLKFDLENATLRADGSLKKQDRNDPAQQLDLLDCARYAANTFLPNFTAIN